MATAKTTKQKRDALSGLIRQKKSFSFTYKEETQRRSAFPYTLGLIENREERDREGVRIYLTEKGGSKSEFVSGVTGKNSSKKDPEGKNFRLVYLDDLTDLNEETEEFEPHSKYVMGDRMFSRITEEVEL